MTQADVIVIGAGAAGLLCAIEAGKRGRSVLVLEHAEKIGEKIRISGGGRCNFTNILVDERNFISRNPHFCRSAIARYTPADFIAMVERHNIGYHEKKLGQLFCDGGAQQIIDMLQLECNNAGVRIRTRCEIGTIERDERFSIETSDGMMQCSSLVIATGGLSIPQLGATSFGYKMAKQFGLNVTSLTPGLVPLLLGAHELKLFQDMSGISLDAVVCCKNIEFRENILFTHRGLSGPAILQISSFWNEGDPISINLFPESDAYQLLKNHHQSALTIAKVLEEFLPRRFSEKWCEMAHASDPIGRYSLKELAAFAARLHKWQVNPVGTEGFGKAEVTVGGIDTGELSSKTMETRKVPGLYFIGEVVDVTGWLGGYNFQWAWSSGVAAGQYA